MRYQDIRMSNLQYAVYVIQNYLDDDPGHTEEFEALSKLSRFLSRAMFHLEENTSWRSAGISFHRDSETLAYVPDGCPQWLFSSKQLAIIVGVLSVPMRDKIEEIRADMSYVLRTNADENQPDPGKLMDYLDLNVSSLDDLSFHVALIEIMSDALRESLDNGFNRPITFPEYFKPL